MQSPSTDGTLNFNSMCGKAIWDRLIDASLDCSTAVSDPKQGVCTRVKHCYFLYLEFDTIRILMFCFSNAARKMRIMLFPRITVRVVPVIFRVCWKNWSQGRLNSGDSVLSSPKGPIVQ